MGPRLPGTRDEPHLFTISASQHEPSKYDSIDTGARLEDRPISVIPPSVQAPPTNVRIIATTAITQGLAVTTATIQWDAPANAVAYEVEWKRDSGDWISLPRTGNTEVGIYAGAYLARVRAVNVMDVSSVQATSSLTTLEGKVGTPPALASLTTTPLIFGIGLNWLFPDGAEDTQRTEFEYANNATGQDSLKLGDFAYPQSEHELHGLAAGTRFWFRARLVDRLGNVGPWTSWVDGISSTDVSAYDAYFAEKIGETALGQHLAERIDLIDGDGPGSVNERISEAVAEFEDALAYDPESTYAAGDTVRGDPNGRRLYQALQAVPVNTPPPNATYWLDIGQVVQTANGLALQVAQNTADISELDGSVEAQASSLTALRAAARPVSASGDKADSLRGWYAQAQYAQQVKTVATNNEASVTRDTQLTASVGSVDARLTIEESTRATADAALATRTTTLEARMPSGTGTLATSAAVQDEATARATADTALASRTTTIEVRMPSGSGALATSASVQTVAQAQADQGSALSAMWSVKVQINSAWQYEYAGIGLGVENVAGSLQSQFLVRANRFAILNNSGEGAVVPFVVQGGQTIISSAVIGDATINFAKISDDIQSTNYVSGQTGWKLSKNGTLEINATVSGGGRMTLNNQTLQVWDTNGVLRVRLGIWS
ncbi:phage tail tip fiber protein [Pseudomonas sp. LRF_L74]|uniref:phage tail protein n=1 Tax=Pseudomonas sp. LRF_L74 TaxID=3369422 RepID=UPI003F6320FC